MVDFSPKPGTRAKLLAFALLFIGILGCGSGNNALVPVEGRVWLHGQILTSGTLVFVPDEEKGHHGRMAFAVIEQGGVYRLLTDNLPGAEPGWYRISIAHTEAPGSSRIAKRFSDPNQSGIHRQILPGVPNSIDITIE